MTENTTKKDRIVTVIIVTVVIFLIGFNVFSYYGASIVLPGRELPFISGLDPENNAVTKIDLSNGVFIVNFWATWCGACLTEIPALNEISKKHNLYGVLKHPFKKDVYNSVSSEYKSVIAEDSFFENMYLSVFPTTILVKDGIITKVHAGLISEEIINEWTALTDE